LFVEYEVELRSPPLGDRAIKSYHFVQDGSKGWNSTGSDRHPSLFHESFTTKTPELQAQPDQGGHQHTSKYNTLALRTGHVGTGVYSHPDTADPVELTEFNFREPFTGLMTLNADTTGFTLPFVPTFTVNGERSDGSTGKLTHPSPQTHKSPIVEHVRTIGDGVASAMCLYKWWLRLETRYCRSLTMPVQPLVNGAIPLKLSSRKWHQKYLRVQRFFFSLRGIFEIRLPFSGSWNMDLRPLPR
jgi:hypothetical protein